MPICRIYNSFGTELAHFTPSSKSDKLHWSVGRSSKCDVCLKAVAETSISRQHFTLDYESDGAWHIHDTSRAGLVYNGQHVTEMKLENGMVFRFAQLFIGIGDRAVPSKYRLAWGRTTNQSGVLWHGVNEIGASHDNTIMIREGDIARKHCLITVTADDELYIANVSSLVHTEINGVQLKGTDRTLITPDDRLSFADFDVDIELADASAYKGENILSEEELKLRNARAPALHQMKVFHIVLLTLLAISFIIWLASFLISLLPK